MTIGIDASRANKENKTGTEWYSYYVIEELKKIPLLSKEGQGEVLSDTKKEGASKPLSGLPLERGEVEELKFILYTNTPLRGDLEKMPTPPQPSPYKGEGDSVWQEKVLSWPPTYLWTQIRLWWELLIYPPDVLFVPAHTIPFLPLRKKIKVCVNVHDVGFKRFPALYKPIQVWYHDLTMRKIKASADVIITISEFSRREIIELYQVPTEKIKVVYLGYDKEKYHPFDVIPAQAGIKANFSPPFQGGVRGGLPTIPANPSAPHSAGHLPLVRGGNLDPRLRGDDGKALSVLKKYNITRPYLLYVGRLEKKKNIGNLIKALALLKENFLDLKLVLAGSAGNQYEEIRDTIMANRLSDEVILPGYVAEEDMPLVMAAAQVFVFTTLYEGFGLPLVQAMASGTPVVASDLDPHREVAAGAAVLVNPKDPKDIAAAIGRLLSDAAYRQEMIDRGLKRAQDFSWQKTAAKILEILKSQL